MGLGVGLFIRHGRLRFGWVGFCFGSDFLRGFKPPLRSRFRKAAAMYWPTRICKLGVSAQDLDSSNFKSTVAPTAET